jgi:hypothetical protein
MPLRLVDDDRFSSHSGRSMSEQSWAHLDLKRGLTKHDWYLNKIMGYQMNEYAGCGTHLREALMISQQVLYLGEDLMGGFLLSLLRA